MSNAKPTRALARGLEVIQALNERHSTSLCLLREKTGMSRATLLRILNTLDAAGWVYRYRADSSYRLASAICTLGQHVLTTDRIAERAGPVLDALYEATGWPSDIAVCNGHGMRVLDSTRRCRPELGSHDLLAGQVHMLWSALGRAWLAFCPAAEREAVLERLRRSADELDQAAHNHAWVQQVLEETRARGYAVAAPDYARNRLRSPHALEAIAVPVEADGRVLACLNLVWMVENARPPRIDDAWLPALRYAAEQIAAALSRGEARNAA